MNRFPANVWVIRADSSSNGSINLSRVFYPTLHIPSIWSIKSSKKELLLPLKLEEKRFKWARIYRGLRIRLGNWGLCHDFYHESFIMTSFVNDLSLLYSMHTAGGWSIVVSGLSRVGIPWSTPEWNGKETQEPVKTLTCNTTAQKTHLRLGTMEFWLPSLHNYVISSTLWVPWMQTVGLNQSWVSRVTV